MARRNRNLSNAEVVRHRPADGRLQIGHKRLFGALSIGMAEGGNMPHSAAGLKDNVPNTTHLLTGLNQIGHDNDDLIITKHEYHNRALSKQNIPALTQAKL